MVRPGTLMDARAESPVDGSSDGQSLPRLKVAVLMGGKSAERRVSLDSGDTVVRALTEAGLIATPVVLEAEHITPLEKLDFDVVFVAMHGPFGEDGRVQDLLEAEGYVYTGSDAPSSRLAMDKLASKAVLEQAGIPVPPGEALEGDASPFDIIRAVERIGLPAVIKPCAQGSSIGVTIVRERGDVAAAFERAAALGSHVLLESFVGQRELAVGILEDRPLPVVELVTRREFYDYESKYIDGITEYLFDFELPEGHYARIQQIALDTHKVLGCRDFARVDMRYSETEGPYVLELNSIPGLTSHSLLPKAAARAGISFPRLVRGIVELAAARRSAKRQPDL